jgi:hypothetical protein
MPLWANRPPGPAARGRANNTISSSRNSNSTSSPALRAARAELGTGTNTDTVIQTLPRAGRSDATTVRERLDLLARADLAQREQAWH